MSRTRGALSGPPAKLPSLPELTLGAEPLWRILRSGQGPTSLASDEFGRFNLASPEGTIYTAQEPLGAFIEVFGRLAILDATELRGYRLSGLEATGARIADLTDRKVLGSAGLTAEIHSTTDHAVTRAWGSALAGSGFAGVRYRARHNPAGSLTSIALFGGPGAPAPEIRSTEPIPDDLLRLAETEFGLIAVPRRLRRR